MDKLAAGILLTAQGVPLIHAGDEFLRSKHLDANSFNNNDPRVNPIDWSLKEQHAAVFDFYRGMIALRKGHPAFRMSDRAMVDQSLKFVAGVPANVLAYVLANHANGDPWKNILVIYNGTREVQQVPVPGDWIIVADGQRAGTSKLASVSETIRVAPCSLVVAHDPEKYPAQ
jgi:pullulanase